MFNKVLIANRGAIATRIIRTLKQMNIIAVAVYAEADRDALHVTQAHEAWSLGSGTVADTYLDQDKLLAIMRQSGADAVHPGYGLLSENADFVTRCEQAGICFIGPTPEQMRAFGLKHTARRLAQQYAIPLLPGSDLLATLESAVVAADAMAYPVILKSTAGGGGIGMQVCRNAGELRKAYDSVRRLGENNFSNSGVFLEKFIERARHIEVQIFGDGRGNAIAIGERDCSTQRRNQKVIEETPAPNISGAVRDALYATAVRLVRALNYRNAGTVEFIYDETAQEFYFLEVNTRLQVEHGVTEQVYGVDLVKWMIQQAAEELPDLAVLARTLTPRGHAVQARLYAEDPNKNFLPSTGLLTHVYFPAADDVRIDHWIENGTEVSPYFDPLLAKVIVTADDRDAAIRRLHAILGATQIYGVETNIDYVRAILHTTAFAQGQMYTRYLNEFLYRPDSIDVVSAGTLTTVQDYPGRLGYWDVGVPPSGPFDAYSFRLGNRLLDNPERAAGLEITLNGPTLRFNNAADIVLTGAVMPAMLDDRAVPFWQVIHVHPGQTLKLGQVGAVGARSYLMVKGGIQCPDYLGAKATFTLGQFGGHGGRALRAGDVLHLTLLVVAGQPAMIADDLRPAIDNAWTLRVIYGPHGAPDFFTPEDIQIFFQSQWQVHYNSSRTGVRLMGPKPQWARSDGGEAGMHPSNIHDNAYAIGAVDFTGDMPVILGPDGPSLGGFVCPATVIHADLWKIGQLKAGDQIRFEAVDMGTAVALARAQDLAIATLEAVPVRAVAIAPRTPILKTLSAVENGVQVVYRACGDRYLLVEYGPPVLDIALRFRVHALMLWLQNHKPAGVHELTPGIRSLQIHYDSLVLTLTALLDLLQRAESALHNMETLDVPARVVHLPLSWDDDACRMAIDKYMQSVRKDAPWCPSNIEFIRRINGLSDIAQVREIVFNARYLVMGLGDVYLGAPVATPLDPRHRLVTTKYNPARTWTAENSVGIGGSYLCVYGMEGPGGYQFVGRTLQMWNRHRQTAEFDKPWLLRFFDQIQFYPVSAQELEDIRRSFPRGGYPLKIETTTFSLKSYEEFLAQHAPSIADFTRRRERAFGEELQRWIASGQMNFESDQDRAREYIDETIVPEHCLLVASPVAGSVWEVLVKTGDSVAAGQTLLILESMKMEIPIVAPSAGVVYAIHGAAGNRIATGQTLLILQEHNPCA